jgi:hypothetical protein
MVTKGYLKKKNWFTPEIRTAQIRPTTQARKVDDGIVGSSVLATAERTSGYGDSSIFILKRRGRWVKIWVIVVVDSHVLSVPNHVA